VLVFTSDSRFNWKPTPNGYIEWSMNDGPLLGGWNWLYMIGIFVPLFLLYAFYAWADPNIAVLILYGALSAAYVLFNFPSDCYHSIWSYLAIGFAFITWYFGIFPTTENNNIPSDNIPYNNILSDIYINNIPVI
jgi:hypothetical protein